MLRPVDVLKSLEWGYPPADAIDPKWGNGPARCPSCFMEWSLNGDHMPSCALKRAVEGFYEV
jgi:hypothetical protein